MAYLRRTIPRTDDDPRLFDPDRDLLSKEELAAAREQALTTGEGQSQPDLDSARMYTSRDDGLLVRGVLPHSAEKSSMVSKAIGTVSTAMGDKWFARKYGLQYLEVYAGPGRLLDRATGKEQLGSPMQALELSKPFTFYVFNDYSDECCEALRQRVGDRANVRVDCGDANARAHLEKLAGHLNERALVIAYLDPARPQDLHWSTVQFLADRFAYIDLIINVPVFSLMRGISGAHAAGGMSKGTAGRFLNHPRPHELLRRLPNGKLITGATIDAIREHCDEQLMDLGFKNPARRIVELSPGTPYYDVILASRHPTGLQLWNKANPSPVAPQLSMLELLGDN